MGRENKEEGTMPTCHCLTFMCCQPCLPTFQCFQVFFYHEHLLYFLLPCQSRRCLGNVSFGGRILGLIRSVYHGWLSMMTSSKGPLFILASAPPTLNPPLVMLMCLLGSSGGGSLSTQNNLAVFR